MALYSIMSPVLKYGVGDYPVINVGGASVWRDVGA